VVGDANACWRLWVTITIATLLAQLDDQLLDHLRRLIGSSAEHGSSSSSTSGSAASARAMQSRCCWPPESRSAGRSRSSDLVEQAGAVQRLLDGGSQLGRCAGAALGLLAQHVGDVVEDAHRERVRLLEDHRHAPAQRVRLELVRCRSRRA
jgi:hypothetical protein